MTRDQILTGFLEDSEKIVESGKTKIPVFFNGTRYMVPETGKACFDALYANLPDWISDRMPDVSRLECFVLRKTGGKPFVDLATWYSGYADVPLPNAWCGKGFYRNFGGTMMQIDVTAWIPRPE